MRTYWHIHIQNAAAYVSRTWICTQNGVIFEGIQPDAKSSAARQSSISSAPVAKVHTVILKLTNPFLTFYAAFLPILPRLPAKVEIDTTKQTFNEVLISKYSVLAQPFQTPVTVLQQKMWWMQHSVPPTPQQSFTLVKCGWIVHPITVILMRRFFGCVAWISVT
jgi:hypothetical protein